ncbi:MAG: transcription termination/antitermination protein NusG, partial [Actinomycetota bacterium]|nr:transcription termination/antitermination protein NusG [Actinomycetota bacterium]
MVDTFQPPPDDSDKMTSFETQIDETVEPATPAGGTGETTEPATAADEVLAAEEAAEEAVDPTILEVPDLSNAELVDVAAVDEEDEVESRSEPSPFDRSGRWYVVHTYAGYENKVKSNLASRVRSMAVEDRIFEVVIPMEDVIEFKNGRKVVVQKKVFPGYLLVRMG